MLHESHFEDNAFGTSCGQPHQADWLRDDFCTGIFLEPLHFVHKAKVETGTVEKVKGQGFARFEGLMWRSEFES